MKKSCLPANHVRALKAQRNNPTSQIAQLEGKLDGLFSILEANQALNCSSHSPRRAAGIHEPAGLSSLLAFALDTSPGDCLAYFRDHMLKYFPFLQPPTDVQWLRRERPFLFLCIMAVATQSTSAKIALGEHIRNTLAQRVYIDKDPALVNIDLLLGLLAFLAWGHDHLIHRVPHRVSRYTQLAMTIVYDLRLNKPSPDDSNMLPKKGNSTFMQAPRCSLEERRALLGCYVMSSMYGPYPESICRR